MKKLPTYTEQFNKITEAYIRDEMKPMSSRFCFCGTLDKAWTSGQGIYDYKEYNRMERHCFQHFRMWYIIALDV